MAAIPMNPVVARVAEISRLLIKARGERDEKAAIVKWLEQELAEATQALGKTGAPATPETLMALAANATNQLLELQANLSVRQKSAVILAAQPEGLTIPALLLELRKQGWQSTSENPANVVNSILNRSGRPFRRMGDRWFHEKFFQQEPNGPATTESKETAVPSVTKTAS